MATHRRQCMECGLRHADPLPLRVRPETSYEFVARDLYHIWIMALGVVCVLWAMKTPAAGVTIGGPLFCAGVVWWTKAEHRVEDAAGLRAHGRAGR